MYPELTNNIKFWKTRNSIIINFFHNKLKLWFYDLSELGGWGRICLFLVPFRTLFETSLLFLPNDKTPDLLITGICFSPSTSDF